jgi:DNA polymerase delta subunit 3
MLYEFYTKENAKTPKSVHATYLLIGRKRSVEDTNGATGRDGDDIIMQSSPPMSSMPLSESQEPAEEPVPRSCVVLVREEELEGILKRRILWRHE